MKGLLLELGVEKFLASAALPARRGRGVLGSYSLGRLSTMRLALPSPVST